MKKFLLFNLLTDKIAKRNIIILIIKKNKKNVT